MASYKIVNLIIMQKKKNIINSIQYKFTRLNQKKG